MELVKSPIPEKVTVLLDHERELKYPLPSIWKFEDLTGLDVLNGGIKNAEDFYGNEAGKPARNKQKTERVIDLLWAGLIADEPELTRERVGAMMLEKFKDLRAFDAMLLLNEFDSKCGKAFFAALVPPTSEQEASAPLTPEAASPTV